ncbi:MAG: acetate--CoA ligase family protein [Rhodospirillales bacterium]
MDLSRLLRPKSLAVLGGAWADTVESQCRKLGFNGPVWRVHPRRAAAGEAGVYAGLDALPAPPDGVFAGVNRETTVEVTAQLARMGAGGAVCFASGFGELHTDETRALTNDLKAAAGGMPFLGPNCYGMINFFDRVSLWPDEITPRAPKTGIALLSQSGTVGLNITYADRSLPLGYIICAGNQTAVGFHDLMDAMLDDPRVTVIGMYVEGFTDLKKFAASALRARAKGVPVVVIKAGRSALARSTVHSHTGALGGEDRYMDALFKRLGVARCATLSEFIETCKFLHIAGPLPGNRLMLLGCSGGDMAMAADVLDKTGLELPPPDEKTKTALNAVLGGRVTAANPLDFQTYIWHEPEKMRECFKTAMNAGADVTAMLLDHPDPATCDLSLFEAAFDVYLDAARETGARAVIASSVPESIPAYMRDRALAAGVAPLQGMAETFAALDHAARIGRVSGAAGAAAPSLDARRAAGREVMLSETQAKAVLAAAGVPVPPGREVPAAEAAAAARDIGFPVALKAAHPGLAHKTEAGGVILNLQNEAEVAAAAERLQKISDRVLVERMAEDGAVEMLVGVHADEQFGPVIIIGAGGVLAELLDDTAVLLPPVTADDVLAALSGLRAAKILHGLRGAPAADMDALVHAVLAVADYAQANADTLLELDINPLIVRRAGRGVIAADALIRRIEPKNSQEIPHD